MSSPASPAPPKFGASPSKPKVGQPAGLKKLRKKKRAANLNRALDEFDDVDDADLVAGPSKRQRTVRDEDDEASDEEDDEDAEGDGDGDGDEGEGEGELEGDTQDRGDEVSKESDPSRLERINTKRKKQA